MKGIMRKEVRVRVIVRVKSMMRRKVRVRVMMRGEMRVMMR